MILKGHQDTRQNVNTQYCYNFGSVQIKPMEFVDDIADPSREKASAIASSSVLEAIQHEQSISFPAEKCEPSKINCNNIDGLKVNGIGIKVVESALKDKINTVYHLLITCLDPKL